MAEVKPQGVDTGLSEAGLELKRSMDISEAKKRALQSLALVVFNQNLGPDKYGSIPTELENGFNALEAAKTPSVEFPIRFFPGQDKAQLDWLAHQISIDSHVIVSVKEDGLKRSFILSYKQ